MQASTVTQTSLKQTISNLGDEDLYMNDFEIESKKRDNLPSGQPSPAVS